MGPAYASASTCPSVSDLSSIEPMNIRRLVLLIVARVFTEARGGRQVSHASTVSSSHETGSLTDSGARLVASKSTKNK